MMQAHVAAGRNEAAATASPECSYAAGQLAAVWQAADPEPNSAELPASPEGISQKLAAASEGQDGCLPASVQLAVAPIISMPETNNKKRAAHELCLEV